MKSLIQFSILMTVTLLTLNRGIAQTNYSGKSWSKTQEFTWQHSGCIDNTTCDDGNLNTVNDCIDGYCKSEELFFLDGFVYLPNGTPMAPPFIHNGNLWVSSDSSLSQYDGENWIWHDRINGLPTSTNDYSDVGIWFLSEVNSGFKLSYYDYLNWTHFDEIDTNVVIFSNPITDRNYLASNNDGLWIATKNHGVYLFDGTVWVTYDTNNSNIVSNHIYGIYLDKNSNVWVTTPEGISIFNGINWDSFTPQNSDIHPDLRKIEFDTNNQPYILSLSGLQTFNGTFNNLYSISDGENFFLSDDYIIIHTTSGNIHYYDYNTWEVYTPQDLGLTNLSEILIDSKNNLWCFGSHTKLLSIPDFNLLHDFSNLLGGVTDPKTAVSENYIAFTTNAITANPFIHFIKIDNPIEAVNDSFTTYQNTPINGNVLQNDIFTNNQITVSQISNTIGNLTLGNDGGFSYNPSTNFIGIDSFQYSICNTETPPDCSIGSVYIEVLNLPNDLVWPGDANYDGIVNVWDVLSVGVAYNSMGFVRPDANNIFIGQACGDWEESFSNGLNYKHTDCTGNGIVDDDDIDVIDDNYGLTHQKIESRSGNGIPLYFEFEQKVFEAGSNVSGTINLGTDEYIAENVYGIAFSIDYDNTIIEENSFQIDFSNSWLAAPDANVSLSKDFFTLNRLDIGHSRINQTNLTGFGPIAAIHFNIQENLAGKTLDEIQKMLVLSFSNILVVDNILNEIDVTGKNDTLTVFESPNSINSIGKVNFSVYPNPTNSSLIHIESDQKISHITIYNTFGQVVSYEKINHETQFKINTSKYPKGIYILEVTTIEFEKSKLKLIKN